jgi:type IV pilus biogenesis protein CpaD/CtpE
MILKTMAATTVLIALVGCESTRVEQEYGESVRQMINAQVYDPSTLTNPSAKPVEGADPDMVNNAIEAFRGHVSAPEDVGQDIVIQTGGQ